MKTLTTLLTLALTLISLTTYSQNYSPLQKGSKKSFKTNNAFYTIEFLKKTLTLNDHEYIQSVTSYSWGKSDTTNLRIDEQGNRIYLDPISLKESIDFPKDPEKGFSWKSTDGAWKYEIYDIGSTFASQKKTYTNCLVIKAEQITGRDKTKFKTYYNYYAEGIGYVGSKTNRGLISWMVKYKPGK